MQSNIDEFLVFRSAVFLRGWSERPPEWRATLALPDNEAILLIEDQDRPDLMGIFGDDARSWGFEGSVLLGKGVPAERLRLVLRSSEGEKVIPLTQHFAEQFSRQHDQAWSHFVRELRATPNPRVIEIGSRARSGIARRELFGENYLGVDILPGENVDVIADAHFLSDAVQGPFDFAYSVSTFEHLMMPWQAAVEIAKIMRIGGLIFVQAPQTWPLHDEPWDFFRFSRDAWRALFNYASGFEIVYTGYGENAVCVSTQYNGSPVTRMDYNTAPLASWCVARKVSEPHLKRWVGLRSFKVISGGNPYPG